MKYTSAQIGRIFIVRLEDGEVLHEAIEGLAQRERIRSAVVLALGGADTSSRLVVGPKHDRRVPVHPQTATLTGAHELLGVGTLFPDEKGDPILHLHAAVGRARKAMAGCVRLGVKTWHIIEAVIIELTDHKSLRLTDPTLGFKLLWPQGTRVRSRTRSSRKQD